MDDEGNMKDKPIMLMGHSSDSAGFQLAAARALMTPVEAMFEKGVKYLTLGIGESNFASPYLGPLPSIAYLDYDHEMRLLFKCLKYPTLELTLWPGEKSVLISIEHLKELKEVCADLKSEVPFSDNDLLFARYLDQNCDAALKVFSHDVADLLDEHVKGSNGTSLYIRAITYLMMPFVQPSSNPNTMQNCLNWDYSSKTMEKSIGIKKR